MTRDYGFEHDGVVFTPNGTVVAAAANAARNAAIERTELEAWDVQPERFAGYVVNGRFQTWTGADLGRVEVRSRWRCWRRECGVPVEPYTMESIVVHGSNGARYCGRYGSDWSQLCRVRRAK